MNYFDKWSFQQSVLSLPKLGSHIRHVEITKTVNWKCSIVKLSYINNHSYDEVKWEIAVVENTQIPSTLVLTKIEVREQRSAEKDTHSLFSERSNTKNLANPNRFVLINKSLDSGRKTYERAWNDSDDVKSLKVYMFPAGWGPEGSLFSTGLVESFH